MKLSNIIYKIVAVLLALCAWQAAAHFTNLPILLPSPLDVLEGFVSIWKGQMFAVNIITTFDNIVSGFLWGFFAAAFFAVLAGRFRIIRELLWPYMITIKSVPVASFIIIALLWISTDDLSGFISFLMVFPIVYNNILEGYKSIDQKKIEVAKVFGIPFHKQLIYIYLPEMKPFIISACSTSFGLAWKSGVAAEFIALPFNSIGEQLYYSKIYFESVDLFSWTLILVVISFAFEKLMVGAIKLLYMGVEKL
ncbi:MAG: ABC transporter permease subunit [Ruminococcaceae bacterium]|nr:ABC transporter permease subunit [Oscillospiraceae bacterium]